MAMVRGNERSRWDRGRRERERASEGRDSGLARGRGAKGERETERERERQSGRLSEGVGGTPLKKERNDGGG